MIAGVQRHAVDAGIIEAGNVAGRLRRQMRATGHDGMFSDTFFKAVAWGRP
jgi:hypothetical protein